MQRVFYPDIGVISFSSEDSYSPGKFDMNMTDVASPQEGSQRSQIELDDIEKTLLIK